MPLALERLRPDTGRVQHSASDGQKEVDDAIGVCISTNPKSFLIVGWRYVTLGDSNHEVLSRYLACLSHQAFGKIARNGVSFLTAAVALPGGNDLVRVGLDTAQETGKILITLDGNAKTRINFRETTRAIKPDICKVRSLKVCALLMLFNVGQ